MGLVTIPGIGCGSPFMGMPNLSLNGGGDGVYEQTVVDDVPEVYYPGPGNSTGAKDKSGNGNNASSKGSVQTGIESGLYPCANARKNKAINITAAGDGIISDSTASAPVGDFSIEVWLTAARTVDTDGLLLFGMAKEGVDVAGNIRCGLRINSTGGPVLEFIDTAGTLVSSSWATQRYEINGNNTPGDNQVWHIVVTYEKSSGDIKFYSSGALDNTNAGVNTNGVKAVGTDDIRWCVGDIPSSADSDVMAGIYGAANARIHDVAFYNEALNLATIKNHYNKGRTVCGNGVGVNHPFYKIIDKYNPIFWVTGDDSVEDIAGNVTPSTTSIAYTTGHLGNGDTTKAIDFSGAANVQAVYAGASINSKIANLWDTTTSRTVMFSGRATVAPSGSTHRMFGTSDSTLNEGWDCYTTSSSPYNVNIRERNAGSEDYFSLSNFSTYGTAYLWQARYRKTLNESGMWWKSGSYNGSTLTNGSSAADATGNDFWLGWQTGATGTGYDGEIQHLCIFDEDFADHIMLDFYEAYAYDGDIA